MNSSAQPSNQPPLTVLIPILLAIVFNHWTVARFFTSDGKLDSLPSIVLLGLFQAGLLCGAILEGLAWKNVISRRLKTFIYLLCALGLVVFLAIVEIYLRLHPQLWVPRQFLALHQQSPESEAYLRDYFSVQSKPGTLAGLRYYDYFLFSRRPIETQTINFTNYFSARKTPDSVPLKEAQLIVWMFGGSTTEEVGAPDQLTIANQIAVNLNREIKAAVMNFGTGSFQSSLESVKFQELLRRVPPDQQPDVVLFYDGFNDSFYTFSFGAGNIQADVSEKLALLVEGRYLRLTFYSAVETIAAHLHVFRPIEIFFLNRMFSRPVNNFSDENISKGVSIYLANIKMIEAVCQSFRIRPLFLLQPLITTKKGLTGFEQPIHDQLPPDLIRSSQKFYAQVRAAKPSAHFRDLSGIFDDNGRPDFVDYGHTGPHSGADTGKAIAEIILQKRSSHVSH